MQGSYVVGNDPGRGTLVAVRKEAFSRRFHQLFSHPLGSIGRRKIDAMNLGHARRSIGVARGAKRNEAAKLVREPAQQKLWLAIGDACAPHGRALIHRQCVQKLRHELRLVGALPGVDVHRRDGLCVLGCRGCDAHTRQARCTFDS